MGAIRKSKSETGFLSTIFLRKKSDGSNRPIFDLRELNLYLNPPKFKLINHHRIPNILNKEDYMTKIDLSQAYLHIPIAENHCRYLSFAYEGVVYEMTCLPFGLASAPCAFANITNWLANVFREQSIRILVYLDDFLIMHSDSETLRKHTQIVVNCLINLGWCVNWTKSTLTPSRRLEYLGVEWDTLENTKNLPASKIKKNRIIIKDMLRKNQWSWLTAKILLGNVNFASFVVPHGRLHCRILQREANRLPEEDRNKLYYLPLPVVEELEWWLKNIDQVSPIHIKGPTSFVSTDAALDGWGATVNGSKLWGTWDQKQHTWHSNQKELWTIKEVLMAVGSELHNQTVMVQTDNKTAVAYIMKEGGTKSTRLLQTTFEIFNLTNQHNIHLIARYLPGRYNLIADSLSRTNQLPEWSLSREILDVIFNKFGIPSIDLFASRRSAIVNQYVSEDALDPDCAFVNAFSQTWNYPLGWIFPPPALIPLVLLHLQQSVGTYLLVAPKWEKTFWKADLRQRAICPPLTIWKTHIHLIDLATGKPPPQAKKLCLQVWKIQAGIV